MGLVDHDEHPSATALAGGVSSEIWRVDTRRGPICVKRALARLRVAQDWRAPVERNAYEAAWLRVAREVLGESAPPVLGEDRRAGLFAMPYLDPADHPVWKARLRDGDARPEFAGAVGQQLARIHAATAGDGEVARAFATDRLFTALRLDPYLVATAAVHRELEIALLDLVRVTATTRRCLVHGDVSPKNILVGPPRPASDPATASGTPVLLDAECAWYGDPAFDLAFCLNHLLLKCLWVPAARTGLLACFDALAARYLARVDWEPPAELELRAARLLPGLALARVDGKSPVEYLVDEGERNRVRAAAVHLLRTPSATLAGVRRIWQREIER
ncbi:MAG: aminoglycoside phosphotransferase family protein [Ectothiorhodospiraceae bacterium]|nr:aminoglycoside phosphotransferase family protein [Ectothiorhodospiraceae bacterium]